MKACLRRYTPQPLTGSLVLCTALAVLVASWIADGPSVVRTPSVATLLLAVGLVVGVVLTYQFPIHIRYNTKIYMGSIPLYLMAALLPPPLAATAAGFGIFAGEMTVRSEKGGELSDLAGEAGRWAVVALLGSVVAHVAFGNGWLRAVPIVLAALVLWTGDILTLPVTVTPMSGEKPLQVIRAVARQAGLPEGAQYLVGILGALAAMQQVWALALLVLPTTLVYLAFKNAKEMHEGTSHLLESLADTVDLRDPYTGGHSRRVTQLTSAILVELQRHGPEAALIIAAARVHDIGKIGIPDHVLKKEGPLTREEKALIEAHPDRGAELLARYSDFARGTEIVRHHHERWDGEGYPHGLKGAEIPFGARIIAVADSYDAMTSHRPYRGAMSANAAAHILSEGRGRQWDATIVDAFLRAVADRLSSRPAVLRLVDDTFTTRESTTPAAAS